MVGGSWKKIQPVLFGTGTLNMVGVLSKDDRQPLEQQNVQLSSLHSADQIASRNDPSSDRT